MRKTKPVTITAEGRDKGKQFLITEMPAAAAEMWAIRSLMGMAKSNIDLPENITATGMLGLAALGARAFLTMPFADAEPLLDEMMKCVVFIPDPARPQVTRPIIVDDIDEVSTLFTLRREVIELHVGFSIADTLFPTVSASSTTTESAAPTSPIT